ncbi:hypothetical protein BU16DRAFT_51086 [Lophium mytilinum]|uniref:Uncharacterized protein n=1 Tax=Lophium mytilinum TaxID=390894 RepID=A0A6A6QRA2_9PEZI|nr:hypothetical protein BU16DRAFT_51086 [Lophium mytilinum]
MAWRLNPLSSRSCLNLASVSLMGSIFCFNAKSASALALPDSIGDHFNQMLPDKNVTGGPLGEIQCYALPYGAIGIISHLLTYWTIAWIGYGRVPLWPKHHISSSKFDLCLAAISMITCIPIATVSIHRCRLSWQFILIGVWKLVTSVVVGAMGIHRAILAREKKPAPSPAGTPLTQPSPYLSPNPGMYKQPNHTTTSFFTLVPETPIAKPKHNTAPLWWLILYLLGTVTGMTGLIALIITSFRHNKDVRSLTYGFTIAVIVLSMATAAYWYKIHWEANRNGYTGLTALTSAYKDTFGSFFLAFIGAFGFFAALYSDLVLGAIAQNWGGFPSEDNSALYWTWFVAKRICMFSH